MVFALHAIEITEIGGVYTMIHVLTLSSSNAAASRYTKDWALLCDLGRAGRRKLSFFFPSQPCFF